MDRPYPTGADYSEALRDTALCFAHPTLARGMVAMGPLRMPRAVSGNFGSVFRVTSTAGGREYAVKCFTRAVPDRLRRYRAIGAAVRSARGSWRVDVEYVARGVLVHGHWYPVILMEWIEGSALIPWLEEHLGDRPAIESLAERFAALAAELEDAGIAHGDLQHGNIVVTRDGGLRLIDYDGMYVPALSGLGAAENGHRNYQHPSRGPRDFGPGLDRFSAHVIHLTLRVLAREPWLWTVYHEEGGEHLLLKAEDFTAPTQSDRFTAISCAAPDLTDEFARLAHWATRPLHEVGPLREPLRDVAGLVPAPDPAPDEAARRLPDWLAEAAGFTAPELTRAATLTRIATALAGLRDQRATRGPAGTGSDGAAGAQGVAGAGRAMGTPPATSRSRASATGVPGGNSAQPGTAAGAGSPVPSRSGPGAKTPPATGSSGTAAGAGTIRPGAGPGSRTGSQSGVGRAAKPPAAPSGLGSHTGQSSGAGTSQPQGGTGPGSGSAAGSGGSTPRPGAATGRGSAANTPSATGPPATPSGTTSAHGWTGAPHGGQAQSSPSAASSASAASVGGSVPRPGSATGRGAAACAPQAARSPGTPSVSRGSAGRSAASGGGSAPGSSSVGPGGHAQSSASVTAQAHFVGLDPRLRRRFRAAFGLLVLLIVVGAAAFVGGLLGLAGMGVALLLGGAASLVGAGVLEPFVRRRLRGAYARNGQILRRDAAVAACGDAETAVQAAHSAVQLHRGRTADLRRERGEINARLRADSAGLVSRYEFEREAVEKRLAEALDSVEQRRLVLDGSGSREELQALRGLQERALRDGLTRFPLPVDVLGQRLVAVLEREGVRTAADFTRVTSAVPTSPSRRALAVLSRPGRTVHVDGMSPALARELQEWRDDIVEELRIRLPATLPYQDAQELHRKRAERRLDLARQAARARKTALADLAALETGIEAASARLAQDAHAESARVDAALGDALAELADAEAAVASTVLRLGDARDEVEAYAPLTFRRFATDLLRGR
ncbi:MAG: hypothetical protein HOV68_11540 [Streptomycetaceae bacterium]|nr:hypothetical protein [Streptomycetaceae bacterium]